MDEIDEAYKALIKYVPTVDAYKHSKEDAQHVRTIKKAIIRNKALELENKTAWESSDNYYAAGVNKTTRIEKLAFENGRLACALELAAQCQLNRIVKGGDPDIVEVGKKRLAIYEAALKGKNDENK